MLRLFRQFVLRQLRHDVLRTAITVVGVAAGIAVVLAVRMANTSAVRGFEAALDLTTGRAGLEIVGPAFGIDERLLADLDGLRAYGVTSPVIDGDLVVEVGADKTELLRVLGVDILRDRPVRDYEVGDAGSSQPTPQTAVEFLTLLTDPAAIVVTRAFAERHGLRVGDPLRVVVGDRRRELRVGGLLEAEGPARLLGGRFALMDIAAAQVTFDRLGRLDRIDVRLAEGIDPADAEQAIAASLPAGLVVQRPSRRGQQVEQMLAAFHLNLTALSSIALLVGLFLVYNAISVSVLGRREEIGALRAIGVTRGQVQAQFLGEALVLGALGIAVGLPLAQALAAVTISMTSRTVNTLYVATAAAPPALGAGDAWLAVLIGLPLALVAAWLPAREAAAVPPTAILRGADRALARTASQARTVVPALVLLAVAAGASRLPVIAGLPIAGYISSVTLVFGVALLMPAGLRLATARGRGLWYRLFDVGGWLAHAALGGAVGRVAVSVAALTVSLAMMVAITVMVGSFRQTVVDWVGETFEADLFVGPAARRAGARQATVSQAVEDAVRAHPEAAAVDAFRSATIPYGDSLITLASNDLDVQRRHGGLRFKAVLGDAAQALATARTTDTVIVSEPFAVRYGKAAGDRVSLATPAGPATFGIAGVYYDYSSDRGVVTMDNQTLARHFGNQRPTGLSVYLADPARAEAIRDELLDAVGATAGIHVFTNRSLREEVLRIFDSTFVVTYALQVIAIVVALLGVVGTLMTLVIERRRELAIVRTIGASRGQVRTLIVAEAAMIGAICQAAGLGLGLLLALILVYVVNLQSFGWTIHLVVPWVSLLQMSALVVLATLLAGLYPAQRAMREPGPPREDE